MNAYNKKRILVVDDEPVICQLCRRVLTEEDFEVDIAPDGKVAKAIISERRYGLYLFDIKMPAVSGKELYIWLQKRYPSDAGRVVFITGSAIGQNTESFLQNSGRQVLRKPFTTEELKATVSQDLKAVYE